MQICKILVNILINGDNDRNFLANNLCETGTICQEIHENKSVSMKINEQENKGNFFFLFYVRESGILTKDYVEW